MTTYAGVSTLAIDRRSSFRERENNKGNSAFYAELTEPGRSQAGFESYLPQHGCSRVRVLFVEAGNARVSELAYNVLRAHPQSESLGNSLRELQLFDPDNPAPERDRGINPDVILTRLQPDEEEAYATTARLRLAWGVPVVATLTSRLALADTEFLAEALDDFLVEPAASEELLARIHCAVLRRLRQRHSTNGGISHVADDDVGLCVDDESKSASLFGRVLQLTPKEFELLRLLASERGRVFSDPEIIAKLWPHSPHASPVDVAQYVHRLRKKLHDDPCAPRWIVNIKRFGYMLKRIPTPSESRNSQ